MMWIRSARHAGRLIAQLAGTVARTVLADAVVRPTVRLLQFVDHAHGVDEDCAAGSCSHRWETSTVDGGDNVHVIPLGDRVEHAEDENCICGPRPTAVFRTDGSNAWLHTHHSLDAREATE